MYSQSSVTNSSQLPFFEDGFGMNSLLTFFLRATYAHFLLQSSSSKYCFHFQALRLSMHRGLALFHTPSGLGPVISVQISSMPALKQGLLRWSCHPFCKTSPLMPSALRSLGLQPLCCRPTSRGSWRADPLPEALLLLLLG